MSDHDAEARADRRVRATRQAVGQGRRHDDADQQRDRRQPRRSKPRRGDPATADRQHPEHLLVGLVGDEPVPHQRADQPHDQHRPGDEEQAIGEHGVVQHLERAAPQPRIAAGPGDGVEKERRRQQGRGPQHELIGVDVARRQRRVLEAPQRLAQQQPELAGRRRARLQHSAPTAASWRPDSSTLASTASCANTSSSDAAAASSRSRLTESCATTVP